MGGLLLYPAAADALTQFEKRLLASESSLAECASKPETGNVIATRSNFPLSLFSNPVLSSVSFDWLHIVKVRAT